MPQQGLPTHQLLNSSWTRNSPCQGGRHFQVVELIGPRGKPWQRLRLQAVLTGRCIEIDRTELKISDVWSAGWLQINEL